ncbi:17.3 kDa class I heat shock protein-like [Zingiber officinale]|uniref:17.3 kDa class I heat shock protein-like n=1 Tax=Zingiber officinale TaxID=94328 RepID=UPI001C4BE881|nr:17.3 kDa class I heat shock protein-like [Zingiber officinale]
MEVQTPGNNQDHKMSFRPFAFGFSTRRSSPLDPFFLDPSYSDHSFPRSGFGDDSAFSAVADARVDWKETREARVFKADLPGRHKRGVKVEVGGSSVHISGERNCKREKKTDTQHHVELEKASVVADARFFNAGIPGRHKRGVKVEVGGSSVQISGERNCKREKKIETRHLVEREKTTETWHRVEREKITETWHRVESEKKTDTRPRVAREKKADSGGEVLRRFRLPANVKADQVEVAMQNRMLTVTVPKEVVKQPAKKASGKSINISG